MQVISVKDVVADARNHFGNRQHPIEGYRGVSLLNDSDRYTHPSNHLLSMLMLYVCTCDSQIDVTDTFLRPGIILSDAKPSAAHTTDDEDHTNDDVSDSIDNDGL